MKDLRVNELGTNYQTIKISPKHIKEQQMGIFGFGTKGTQAVNNTTTVPTYTTFADGKFDSAVAIIQDKFSSVETPKGPITQLEISDEDYIPDNDTTIARNFAFSDGPEIPDNPIPQRKPVLDEA